MADFYNPTPDVTADWSSSSKGYKASSAVGDAFQGAGDALKMGVAAADNYYQGTIKEQAKAATDELFASSGNDGAVATEAGVKGSFTPQEIQRGYNQLKLLDQATKTGTLKESSFWAQAELISRQLKTRYPGYWEEIDGTMSQLVGRKPAQALHSELESERKAGASQDEVSHKNALVAARSAGLTGVFAREGSGKPYTTNEINFLVAQREAIKWDRESSNFDYNQKKQTNELTESDAMLAQRTDASTEMSNLLADSASPLFANVQEYKAYTKQINDYRTSGQPIPPELEAKANATAGMIKQALGDLTNKHMAKYAGDIPQTKMKENIGFVEEWGKNFLTNVQAGETNYTTHNMGMLKSMQNHDDYKFMTSNDVLRKSATLTRVMGPQSELNWEVRNGDSKILADRDIMIQKTMEDDQLLSGKPMIESIQTMTKMGVKDPHAYNEMVTRQINAITDPDTPPVIKRNAIEAIYGKKNLEMLERGVPAKERLPVFQKMAAPAVVKEMKSLVEKGVISSEDLQKHVDWVRENGTQLIRDYSVDVNSIATERKAIGIKYNTNTQQLDTIKTDYKGTGVTSMGRKINEAGENWLSANAKIAVNNVNHILNTMKPMLEATGEDKRQVIPVLLENSGIDITPVNDKGPVGLEPATAAVENWGATFISNILKAPESVDWNQVKKEYDEKNKGKQPIDLGNWLKSVGEALAATGRVE